MLLEINDLGIAYGKAEPVVRHVSFTLDQGEILAIVGESGSGKPRSSVLSSMCCLEAGTLRRAP